MDCDVFHSGGFSVAHRAWDLKAAVCLWERIAEDDFHVGLVFEFRNATPRARLARRAFVERIIGDVLFVFFV